MDEGMVLGDTGWRLRKRSREIPVVELKRRKGGPAPPPAGTEAGKRSCAGAVRACAGRALGGKWDAQGGTCGPVSAGALRLK